MKIEPRTTLHARAIEQLKHLHGYPLPTAARLIEDLVARMDALTDENKQLRRTPLAIPPVVRFERVRPYHVPTRSATFLSAISDT